MSWFKLDYRGELLQGDRISGPGFTLIDPTDEPHDGWQWFDHVDDAIRAVYPQGVDEIMLQAKRELAAQYTNKLTVIASDTTITTILKLRVALLRIFSEVEGEIG